MILSNIEIVCICVCIVHFFFDIIKSLILNKRISALCLKCGAPVVDGEKHDCDVKRKVLLKSLSDKDVNALYALLDSLVDTVMTEASKND